MNHLGTRTIVGALLVAACLAPGAGLAAQDPPGQEPERGRGMDDRGRGVAPAELQRLFDAYVATLPQLAGDDDPRAQAALRAFELTLLREIGLLPDLSVVTLTQQPVQPRGVYDLHPEAGVVANGDGGVSGATLLALQAAQDAGQHERLSAVCGTALVPLKLTLRNLLHYHLGSPLLRTRQVMLDVQKLIEP